MELSLHEKLVAQAITGQQMSSRTQTFHDFSEAIYLAGNNTPGNL